MKREQAEEKTVQAAIFDLDGTLVDSMWMWYDIDQEFLGQFGILVPEDLQDCLEGMSFTETAVYFKERFPFLPFSVEQLKDIWNRMAYDKYANEVQLKPGVAEYLQYLKENGVKMGVATSNSRELVTVTLKSLGVIDYFDSIRTSCEVAKGKPSPDIYLLVAKDLEIQPEHCIIFEDVPAGILAGKRAGMCAYAVADLYSDYLAEEKRKLADHWIEDYYELLPEAMK